MASLVTTTVSGKLTVDGPAETVQIKSSDTQGGIRLGGVNSGATSRIFLSANGENSYIDSYGNSAYKALKIDASTLKLNTDSNGTITTGTGAFNVSGSATVTGQSYLNGGLRVGGAGTSHHYAGERLFSIPAFPNGVANQKVELYWTGEFWGYLEIEITGSYTNTNMAGVLTKSFALGLNANNTILQNESWYSNLGGLTAGSFAISDVTWDSTNSRYRIQIVHRNSAGNTVRLKLRCLGDSAVHTNTFMTGTTVGSIYTTDTTAFALPVKELAGPNDNAWLNGGYLGIGTPTPQNYWPSAVNLVVAGSTNVGMSIVSGTSHTGAIAFADGTGVAGYRGRIEYNHSSDKLFLGAGGTTPFVLQSDGNVGIGITNPGYLRHLEDVGSDLLKLRSTGGATANAPKILFEHTDAGVQSADIVFDQSAQNTLKFTTYYQARTDLNRIQFAPADAVAMTICGGTNGEGKDGFVGIGTASPESSLHVEKLTGGTSIQISAGNYGTNYGSMDLDSQGFGLASGNRVRAITDFTF